VSLSASAWASFCLTAFSVLHRAPHSCLPMRADQFFRTGRSAWAGSNDSGAGLWTGANAGISADTSGTPPPVGGLRGIDEHGAGRCERSDLEEVTGGMDHFMMRSPDMTLKAMGEPETTAGRERPPAPRSPVRAAS